MQTGRVHANKIPSWADRKKRKSGRDSESSFSLTIPMLIARTQEQKLTYYLSKPNSDQLEVIKEAFPNDYSNKEDSCGGANNKEEDSCGGANNKEDSCGGAN